MGHFKLLIFKENMLSMIRKVENGSLYLTPH